MSKHKKITIELDESNLGNPIVYLVQTWAYGSPNGIVTLHGMFTKKSKARTVLRAQLKSLNECLPHRGIIENRELDHMFVENFRHA
jgi:hypothetical protein